MAEAFFAERNKIRIANRKKPAWESVDPGIQGIGNLWWSPTKILMFGEGELGIALDSKQQVSVVFAKDVGIASFLFPRSF